MIPAARKCAHCNKVFVPPRERAGRGKFCSPICVNRSNMIARTFTAQEAREKFWRRGERNAAGCLEWTGSRSAKGYGILMFMGRHILAHRLAWELTYGALPPKRTFVLHRCDNRPCFNPDHLFLGTNQDNMTDAAIKGRIRHGEQHHWAKWADEIVQKIRDATGSYREISERFNVPYFTVASFRRGLRRRHSA